MATTPIYVNSGIGAQLIYAPETTSGYGVAASLTAAQPLEFNSETLALTKTTVQGQGLHAGNPFNRSSRRVLTNYSAGGGVNMDLPTRYLNNLLHAMTGSYGQTLSVLTADGAGGAYKAVHAPGSMSGYSLTMQKGVPSIDGTAPNAFTYVGCKVSDWTIAVATGQIASLALTVEARNELAGTGNGDPSNPTPPALGTFTEDPTNSVFHFRQASLLKGTPTTTAGVTSLGSTTVLGYVHSAEVKQAVSLDTTRYFLGSNGFRAEPIENSWRAISGQFVIEWLNAETMYQAFASDTPISLQLQFEGPVIGTGSDNSRLEILIPSVWLDGESPKVSGPGVITQTIPFVGLDDQVNNAIQITYVTPDAT